MNTFNRQQPAKAKHPVLEALKQSDWYQLRDRSAPLPEPLARLGELGLSEALKLFGNMVLLDKFEKGELD